MEQFLKHTPLHTETHNYVTNIFFPDVYYIFLLVSCVGLLLLLLQQLNVYSRSLFASDSSMLRLSSTRFPLTIPVIVILYFRLFFLHLVSVRCLLGRKTGQHTLSTQLRKKFSYYKYTNSPLTSAGIFRLGFNSLAHAYSKMTPSLFFTRCLFYFEKPRVTSCFQSSVLTDHKATANGL